METEIRFKIRHRETFADGESFGNTGQYERIAGEIRFAVDPDSDAYSMVVDLKHAPRNDHGFVEFATDFYILKPADLARGNRRLLYDVNNRGALRMLQFFNDAVHSNTPSTTEHAGNGFLMRRGYSLVWSGWQGDIMPGDGRQTMRLPIATENGEEITGVTRSEFIVDEHGVLSMPLSANGYTSSYEAISTDTRDATFTMREYESDQRQPIADDDWAFARLQNGRPIPSAIHCHLPRGFKPGWIYELVYTAKNPNVHMLGHLSGRLLLERGPQKLNQQAVIDACAETGTWIELNANPYRLDLDWRQWQYAKSKGVKCVINSDAHRNEHAGFLKLGIGVARKGWLTKGDVMNTLPLAKLRKELAKKRN